MSYVRSLQVNHTCCYNQFLDVTTNHCLGCMDGRFGWNCDTPCIKGFYGHLCSKSCECTANSCDPVKGCHTSGLLNISGHMEDIPSKNSGWLFYLVLFLGLLTAVLIVGTMLYFRSMIYRLITRRYWYQCRESTVSRDATSEPVSYSLAVASMSTVIEWSSNLKNNRYSRHSQDSINFHELVSSTTEIRTRRLMCDETTNLEDDDYSRLVLRQAPSLGAAISSIHMEEGEYSNLQPKDTVRPDPDVVIWRCKSWPVVSKNKESDALDAYGLSSLRTVLKRQSFTQDIRETHDTSSVPMHDM
ncbi:uncharacterized protein LOC111135014 isoform X4 [Crassostrea virginica]